MAWFRKDSEKQAAEESARQIENELIDEDVNINFSPLWEDEQASSLAQYILPVLNLILLIAILIVLHGKH